MSCVKRGYWSLISVMWMVIIMGSESFGESSLSVAITLINTLLLASCSLSKLLAGLLNLTLPSLSISRSSESKHLKVIINITNIKKMQTMRCLSLTRLVCVVLLGVFTFWVPCCDLCYDFRIKTIFGLSLPLVVCRRVHVLFTFLCVYLCIVHVVSKTLCCVFILFFFVLCTDPSKCINDQTLRSDREFCQTSHRQMSDQIVRQMSDQILPGRSESLHSQIVKL